VLQQLKRPPRDPSPSRERHHRRARVRPGERPRLRRRDHAPGRPRPSPRPGAEFQLAHDDGNVAAFVEELGRRFSTEHSGRGVNLLTYHRAKGLEFDAVFLPRLLDGELPFRSGRAKAEPDEERRLLYVGITRARTYLFLTWATDAKTKPSPFLDELGVRTPSAPKRAAPSRIRLPKPAGPCWTG
jgi:superfamily I DNA/RNA helicase